jgi:protein-L-isoaspartate(D-aspartate) O-methyltransferase
MGNRLHSDCTSRVAGACELWQNGRDNQTEEFNLMKDFDTRRTMMVDTQIRPSDVTKFPIIDAMLHVPRERFVPATARDIAYMGEHIALGQGRVVLDPRVLAKMLDALDIQPDELVLDLGCGLGYSSAIVARLAEAVVAVEENEDMAAEAEAMLSETNADNVAVIVGPLTQGAAKHGPYDAILLQGGVEEIPTEISDQLKDGGRMAAIFMEGALGTCRIAHKTGGRLNWRDAFNATAPVLPGFARQPEFQL